MDKNLFIRLTFAVHRVIEKLPKEELRDRIENLANDILADLVCLKPAAEKLKELDSYFEAAKEKNFINPINFLILKKEYAKIRERFGKEEDKLSVVKPGFPARQETIFQAVSSNGKTRLSDLVGLLPSVHRRTLLRDVDKLVSSGAIVRNGDGRGTYYRPNGIHKNTT
ncbi:MAG: hypothetical protein HYW70_02770 [Candidatus Nealsonbacteria bacterium]|nr:hypothetical protein [Candidatus Nealsonbacteria bacterium]